MKKYEFSSSLTGVTETIEADEVEYENGAFYFTRSDESIGPCAIYIVGPGSFVREIKESKDA